MILLTNTNKKINCISVMQSHIYNYIEIITNDITPNEIFSIFTDENETIKLTVIENDYNKTYNNYTWFDSLTQTKAYGENTAYSIKLRLE